MSSRRTHSGVVVGVDGSPSARVAVQWAACEATMHDVPLTLVHAAPPLMPSSTLLAWPPAPGPAELRRWQEDEARKIIADAIKAVEDIAEGGDRPEINSELLFSAPVPTLVDLSKEAQMVVVGCRGQGALRRGLLGSVSTGLVHHAHCPVAVVHNEVPSSLRSSKLPCWSASMDRRHRSQPRRSRSTRPRGEESTWSRCTPGATRTFPTSRAWSGRPSKRAAEETSGGTSRRLAGTLPRRHRPPWVGLDSPPVNYSTSPNRPNSSSSVATAAVDSPECYSGRLARP